MSAMTGTRKLLLALAVLIGLLGAFKTYDVASSDFVASRDRDRAAHKEELRALEAGEAPPNGLKLDESARKSRISDLRAWTQDADSEAALDREQQRSHWISALVTLGLAGGLGAAFVLSGKKDGPAAFTRLGSMPAGVIVALLFGLGAATGALVGTKEVLSQADEVARAEERAKTVEAKLKSFPFDASGNVAPERRTEFEMLLSEAKYAPQNLASARERRTVGLAVSVGSIVVLGLSLFFARRSLRNAAPKS